MEMLQKNEIDRSPAKIGECLAQLAIAIEENKGDLAQIQNRNLLQRMVNNNTRDLANAMLKQNDTISAFMTIVQGILALEMNNLVVLSGIMESLEKSEQVNNARDNKYISMAKEYLTESIKAAKKSENTDLELKRISDELIAVYKKDEDQDKKDMEHDSLIATNATKNIEQDQRIQAVIEKDNAQDVEIQRQNEVDKQHDELFVKQEQFNERINEEIKDLNIQLKAGSYVQHAKDENKIEYDFIYARLKKEDEYDKEIEKQKLLDKHYEDLFKKHEQTNKKLEEELKFIRKKLKIATVSWVSLGISVISLIAAIIGLLI